MKRNTIALLLVALCAVSVAGSGCVSTGEGSGIELIESMTDAEYAKWQLYISLGTKIGANRLLEEGLVTEEELGQTADVIDAIKDSQVVPGAGSLIKPALEEAGLTNDEIELLLLVVEQELLARGALEWVNPETGLIALSPRTKELLTIVADSLRSAVVVTEEEAAQGMSLEEQFNGKVLAINEANIAVQ